MTAWYLLLCIGTALLLQVAAWLGVAVWRARALATQSSLRDAPEPRVIPTGAWQGWRDFRVVQRNFEDAAHSQCSFYLQPVDGEPLNDFKPGQYLTVRLPIDQGGSGIPRVADERQLVRCYSLSDQPDPEKFRITVKRASPPGDKPNVPPGLASNYLHDRVQEGDVVSLRAPSGRFFIDADAGVAAVFIAGGIGITPMVSMLRWSLAKQPARTMYLFYGVRNSGDHAFKAMLESLADSHAGFKLHVVYSNPGPQDVADRDYQHAGYIDLDLVRSSLAHGRHQFYVCGPPPMMQNLVPALRQWGVPEDCIHFEAFGPASVQPIGPVTNEPLASPSTQLEVRLNRSGRTLVWEGQDDNLLDFAERHGVTVDSGCRSGSCGTCETRITSGTVHYADRPDYDISAGHCLLCVAKPQSALVLEL